eukprot:scaffold635_cov155-Amphora_coffeaeformis.AAC.2
MASIRATTANPITVIWLYRRIGRRSSMGIESAPLLPSLGVKAFKKSVAEKCAMSATQPMENKTKGAGPLRRL